MVLPYWLMYALKENLIHKALLCLDIMVITILPGFFLVFIIYYNVLRVWVQVVYLGCDPSKHD